MTYQSVNPNDGTLLNRIKHLSSTPLEEASL